MAKLILICVIVKSSIYPRLAVFTRLVIWILLESITSAHGLTQEYHNLRWCITATIVSDIDH
jgi:hypothetical protein